VHYWEPTDGHFTYRNADDVASGPVQGDRWSMLRGPQFTAAWEELGLVFRPASARPVGFRPRRCPLPRPSPPPSPHPGAAVCDRSVIECPTDAGPHHGPYAAAITAVVTVACMILSVAEPLRVASAVEHWVGGYHDRPATARWRLLDQCFGSKQNGRFGVRTPTETLPPTG
jgi:hypothetical protein